MKEALVSHNQIEIAARAIAEKLHRNAIIYPVPRGGVPAAYMVKSCLPTIQITTDVDRATDIVDDIIDSGATVERFYKSHPDTPFHALFFKEQFAADWVTFPWERSEINNQSAEDIGIRLLQYIGEDPNRQGLLETPQRFLKAWREKTSGYGMEPREVLKVFEDGAEDVDEMVLVKDIDLESSCEHHMERIWGLVHIAYIPNGKIIGLSKLTRLTHVFSRRLQVQERLTAQIANALEEHLNPIGVGVVIEARHACMEARGINKRGQTTITSALRGAIKDKPEARAEFLALARGSKVL